MTMIKPWYSYGIQPGSALILLVFLGTVLSLMTICIDYLEIAVGRMSEAIETGVEEAVTEMFVLLEMVIHITLLGYGVIIKGLRPMLIVWMVAEGIYLLIWEIHLIWFLVEYASLGQSFTIVAGLLYFVIYTAAYYGYELNLAMQCLPLLSNTPAEMEPIGKGFRYIFDYYSAFDNRKSAASLVLMSEIMMNLHVFLERHVTEYGLGMVYIENEVGRSTALLLEETFVRYSRVAICIIGFVLAYKEKTLWMFRWCIAYLITLIMSWGIFVYLVLMWRAVHSLLTLTYFFTFGINLIYRTGVLYTCARYSDAFERQRLPL